MVSRSSSSRAEGTSTDPPPSGSRYSDAAFLQLLHDPGGVFRRQTGEQRPEIGFLLPLHQRIQAARHQDRDRRIVIRCRIERLARIFFMALSGRSGAYSHRSAE